MVFKQAKQGFNKVNNNKDIKQSHSRMFLSGIFDAGRYKNRKPYLVNDGMRRDPGQKPSGMTLCDGFTLIELLVVVLIIGILAAVAIPQYQQAVLKAKVMPLVSLLKMIDSAQRVYYLANGKYSTDFANLDIEMPAGATTIKSAKYEYTDFYCTISINNNSEAYSSYCVSTAPHAPALERYYDTDYTWCWFTDDVSKKLCQNLGQNCATSSCWIY